MNCFNMTASRKVHVIQLYITEFCFQILNFLRSLKKKCHLKWSFEMETDFIFLLIF